MELRARRRYRNAPLDLALLAYERRAEEERAQRQAIRSQAREMVKNAMPTIEEEVEETGQDAIAEKHLLEARDRLPALEPAAHALPTWRSRLPDMPSVPVVLG